jgi:2-iminobutanoate/2-iminopropanoate deaminase
VKNFFTHIRNAVEAAGGKVDDIIKINFWMKEPATGRAALNGEWVKMVPDEGSRPARHTLALGADGNALVTCDFVAVFS